MAIAHDIDFRDEADLPVREYADLLHRSGLTEWRPAQEPERLRRMLAQADILLCARDGGGALVGICRDRVTLCGRAKLYLEGMITL